jgi:hypothetical protein
MWTHGAHRRSKFRNDLAIPCHSSRHEKSIRARYATWYPPFFGLMIPTKASM